MHRLADGGIHEPARIEAALELVQRVLAAADAAAEVEALVAAPARPGRRLEEEDVHRAEFAALVGTGAQVVVQPRRRSQAQRARRDLVAEMSVEANEVRPLDGPPVLR